MPKATHASVDDYIASLPEDRRAALQTVRKTILKNLPKGYAEELSFGMPAYVIPLRDYPKTYNKQPLMLAAIASQKNHMAVYLMGVYSNPKIETWFNKAWAKTGKKLDMGKSCVRFRALDDLPLEVIGDVVGKIPVKDLIAAYELSRTK